jgi:HK97 family phage portal protein
MFDRLKALLAPPETKSSRTARLVAFENGGRARWTPRDYTGLAREGYLRNAIVHRSVRLIAENAAACQFLVFEGVAERDGHPLAQLLARPNPRQDGGVFFEMLYAHLLLAGNAYVEAVALGDTVRELYALRPDRMKVVPGADGWAEAYEYSVGGRSVRFDQLATSVPPILHLTFFHPLDDHYGLAPIEAAAVAVDTHNSAARWNKALLDNAARPSGALVFAADNTVLAAHQFDRLKRELDETYSGSANAGRPMLLEGGLDWKAMSLTPKDMDFLEAKHTAAREIALAFGVPPMLLGIPGDNTFANYAEANRTFFRQTVLPLAARVGASLAQWLSPQFGEAIRVTIDTDRIDALAADRAALWDRVSNAPFLTLNEKREAVGYGPVAGGDRWERVTEAKYSPAQLRVPAGSPRGGQWTNRDGGGGQSQSLGAGLAQPMGDVGIGDVSGSSELGDLFHIKPDDPGVDGVQLAGEPIDLLEQQQRGGHTISEHVDRTYDYLKSRARENAQNILDRGDDFRGARVGSFTSVQSANRLVNSTISDNQAKVDQAIRDGEPHVLISKNFKSPTGYEAYVARAHAEPYIRNTFGVEVLIRPDPGSARGWRVHSAYPVR